MTERRKDPRSDSRDRRSFPRPPLWLNLTLLLLAVALFAVAAVQRRNLDRRYSEVMLQSEGTPAEMLRLRSELAELDLTREALASELASRMRLAESLQTEAFHLTIDTKKRHLYLYYGDDVVRDVPMQIGAPLNVRAGDRQWVFVPLRGAFTVRGKEQGASWRVPPWVYAAKNQPAPAERPLIESGLGGYVVQLPNDYVIHTPPPPASPLQGPKPGSFMISEVDMRAIWPRINNKTRVFVF